MNKPVRVRLLRFCTSSRCKGTTTEQVRLVGDKDWYCCSCGATLTERKNKPDKLNEMKPDIGGE